MTDRIKESCHNVAHCWSVGESGRCPDHCREYEPEYVQNVVREYFARDAPTGKGLPLPYDMKVGYTADQIRIYRDVR